MFVVLTACCLWCLGSHILAIDPDICLLQDVDNWKEWWQPQLRRAVRVKHRVVCHVFCWGRGVTCLLLPGVQGYDGLFEQQTGRSRVGVAVLYVAAPARYEDVTPDGSGCGYESLILCGGRAMVCLSNCVWWSQVQAGEVSVVSLWSHRLE